MGPAAHVLPLGHPPVRVSSGASSGAYRLGRTSCASSGSSSGAYRLGRTSRASLGRVPHEDEEGEEEDFQEKEEG